MRNSNNKKSDFWFQYGLRCSLEELKNAVEKVEDILTRAKKGNDVKVKYFALREKSPPYKYAVIDLEGDPPKLFGFVLYNQVYQVFVTHERFLPVLYETIWKVLSELIDFYLFTFSNHEFRFLKKILPFKLNGVREGGATHLLKIINTQQRNFEGLVPALYSVGEKSHHDPLLRESKKVELHFKNKNYYLIMEHNKSCLLSTLKVVKKRYLKLHLI